MPNARVALVDMADRVHDTYNTNERWVVKKMRSEHAYIIVAILPIKYHKDKV
jgi:hypothetical protein